MLLNTLLLAGTASATCLHGLSKFKRQEPAEDEVAVGKFGYTGLRGPFNWASLAPENEACKTGKQQSPINLDDAVTLATERPTVDIPQQAVEFENLGTTIEVIVNGTTSFAGSDFRLRQFHIHTPSEHRIGEEYFPLETHFVHEGVTDPNSIAVISLLFQLSSNASTPLISGLRPHLAAIATPGTKTSIEGGLDFSAMLTHLATSDIFQYSGSLTTPPCSEGITFLVAKSPLPIDVETYNSIKSIVKFNSRYTQNTLGEENMIAVGNRSGTEEQFDPPAQEEEVAEDEAPPAEGETPAAVTPAPVITKGATVVISEIQGQPTSLLGVIVKGK